MPDEEAIREIVRDELESQGSTTRRDFLTLLGGGVAAGALSGGAAAETADSGRVASIGGVTADTYRISGNRYGGPASARSQLESELGNSDAGAKFLGEDNGALFHWTGSSWELMESTSAAVNTERTHTNSATADFVIWKSSGGTVHADAQRNGLVSTSGGDAATAIQHAIDELPSGSQPDKEAHGHVHFRTGEYLLDNAVVAKGGLFVTGDSWDHIPGNPEDHTGVGSRLVADTATNVFVPPDADNELVPGLWFKGITAVGPGISVANSAVWNNSANTNRWDLIWIDHCFGRFAYRIADLTGCDSPYVSHSHLYKAGENIILSRNSETQIYGGTFFAGAQDTGSAGIKTEGRMFNTQIQGAHDYHVNLLNSGRVDNVLFGPGGANFNDVRQPAAVRNCSFTGSPGNYHIGFLGADNTQIAHNTYDGAPGDGDIEVPSGVADVSIHPSDQPTIDDSGTRTRWNGVIGGGPLGGVDLSSTTGQFDGDLAVADGTSTASAGAWARWDADNLQWEYVDPTGTV